MTQAEVSDYIGSARVPLKDINEKTNTIKLNIINEKSMHMGQVEIRLSLYNQGSAQDIQKSIGHASHAAGESRADQL